MMTYHVQFLLRVLAGWVNRQQQDVIDYQQEENRVLRAGFLLPWCITLDNSKGISRLRFWAKKQQGQWNQ